MYKKIISLFLAATALASLLQLGSGFISASGGDSTLAALEDRLAAATAQRKTAEKAVASAEASYADALGRKKAIDEKIYALNLEIDAIEQLISGYDEKIEAKNLEIAAVSEKLDGQFEILKERIRANHEHGEMNLFAIFLETDGFENLLVRFDRFIQMLDYDKELFDSYDEGLRSLEALRDELNRTKQSLDSQKADLTALSETLNDDLLRANRLVATAENKLSSAEADLAKVEAAEARYSAERASMLAELNKATNDSYVGGEFLWPLPSSYTRISSPFGQRIHPVTGKPQFHRGIDIPAPYGTTIFAVNDGTVVECSYNYADGYYITVNHGGGIASFYSHLSKYQVKVGDKVTRGQVIANVGTSGYTTGAHLNLNIYKNGEAVNPVSYFN